MRLVAPPCRDYERSVIRLLRATCAGDAAASYYAAVRHDFRRLRFAAIRRAMSAMPIAAEML